MEFLIVMYVDHTMRMLSIWHKRRRARTWCFGFFFKGFSACKKFHNFSRLNETKEKNHRMMPLCTRIAFIYSGECAKYSVTNSRFCFHSDLCAIAKSPTEVKTSQLLISTIVKWAWSSSSWTWHIISNCDWNK